MLQTKSTGHWIILTGSVLTDRERSLSRQEEDLIQVAANICNEFGFPNIGDELEELLERLNLNRQGA